jgi:hypothetical protein
MKKGRGAFFLIFVIAFGMWLAYVDGKATQHRRDLQIIEQVLDQQQDISCNSEVENQ